MSAPLRYEMEYHRVAHVLSLFECTPFAKDLGVRVTRIADGITETEIRVRARHLQQEGFVHSGVLATLLDHTAGGCAATIAPIGTEVLSIGFNLHLLRPAIGPKLRCQARALRVGKSLAAIEAEIWNVGVIKSLVAKGTVTLALRPKRRR